MSLQPPSEARSARGGAHDPAGPAPRPCPWIPVGSPPPPRAISIDFSGRGRQSMVLPGDAHAARGRSGVAAAATSTSHRRHSSRGER